eukprot:3387760-Pleurochrysis_carterae.AAC.3
MLRFASCTPMRSLRASFRMHSRAAVCLSRVRAGAHASRAAGRALARPACQRGGQRDRCGR